MHNGQRRMRDIIVTLGVYGVMAIVIVAIGIMFLMMLSSGN
jgi:hypothetical protein